MRAAGTDTRARNSTHASRGHLTTGWLCLRANLHLHEWSFVCKWPPLIQVEIHLEHKHSPLVHEAPFVQVDSVRACHSHKQNCAWLPLTCPPPHPRPGYQARKVGDRCSKSTALKNPFGQAKLKDEVGILFNVFHLGSCYSYMILFNMYF